MADSSTNLRSLFSLPESGGTAEASNRWQEFQDRLGGEIKTISWPAAMPDLVSTIGDLFNVQLPDLLVVSWKKAAALQTLLEESKEKPEQVLFLELADHIIRTEYHPYIEIRIAGVSLPKKIEFIVRLSVRLKAILLKIKDGTIAAIETGSCEFEGKILYKDLVIADKKLGPIELRGVSVPALRDGS